MKVNQYLDAAKESLKITSDYALAKTLGIHNGRITEYRKGKTTPDPYIWARLGIILNRDPMEMMAEVELERETKPERLDFWRDFLSRAALVLLFQGLAWHSIGHSQDALADENGMKTDNRIEVSIMRSTNRSARSVCYGENSAVLLRMLV